MATDFDSCKISLARFVRPYLASLAMGGVAVVVETITDLAEPWPLKLVLDTVVKSKANHNWLSNLAVEYVGWNKPAIVKCAAVAVLFFAAVGALCGYVERYLSTSIGERVMHDLRKTLYGHIHRLSLDFHDRAQTGDLVSRLTGDVNAIQGFITSGLLSMLVNAFTLVGMLTLMLCLNRKFTLIALSLTPLLFVIVLHYTSRIKEASRELRRKEGEMLSMIQEGLSSVRLIKAFAREEYEDRRLTDRSVESIAVALRVRNLKGRLPLLVEVIVGASTCLVVWFGGQMALNGTLSSGSLVLLVWYLGKMYKPIRELSKMVDSFSRAAVGFERIREVLDTDHRVKDLPGALRAPKFKGLIELNSVSFGYGPDNPVLKDVSLAIEPGQMAVLVGPAGAGKSTIINLIARFYDPDAGTVKIDGTDIRLFRQESLRQQISFVLQETVLFHGPLWSNIAYGNPNASRADIVRAAIQANAHEFIERLPQGYDTIVGERGVTLSGGQRQRIAIARAAVRDTPILILDEPGTGLDALCEKQVLDALQNVMKSRTSVVIAHKFASISHADVIFVVEQGSIVERGSHTELLRKCKLYAELYDLQVAKTPVSRSLAAGVDVEKMNLLASPQI